MSRASNELREEILYWCRESVKNGLNFNTQGNISIRLPEHNAIVITPSGIRYDVLSIDQMCVVGYDGVVIEGDLFPSTETDVHLAHYRRRPDVNAIVHTESPYANMFGAIGKTIDPVLLNMVLYAKGPVPIMPFEFSTNTDFGELSAALMGRRRQRHRLGQPRNDLRRRRRRRSLQGRRRRGGQRAGALGRTPDRNPNLLVLEDILIPEGARLP